MTTSPLETVIAADQALQPVDSTLCDQFDFKQDFAMTLSQLHATKTYVEIFRTYCCQSDSYQIALAAYQAIVNTPMELKHEYSNNIIKDPMKLNFRYPLELIAIGLTLENPSIVAAGMSSRNLDKRDPIIYQIYLLTTAKPAFRSGLLQCLPDCADWVSLENFWRAIQPGHCVAEFFLRHDLSVFQSSNDRYYDLTGIFRQDLHQFFIDFEQDWVWSDLPNKAGCNLIKPENLDPHDYKFTNLDTLTARYLTGVTTTERIRRATTLANLDLLDSAMYVLIILNETRRLTDLPSKLAVNLESWYHDPIIPSRKLISLSKIVDYALRPGPAQWNIFSLLPAIAETAMAPPGVPAAIVVDKVMSKFRLTAKLKEAFISFASKESEDSYYDLIVGLAKDCDFKTVVTLANQCTNPPELRIRLLLVLADKVSSQDDHFPIELLAELADFTVTEVDLKIALTALDTWAKTDSYKIANLLVWYRDTSTIWLETFVMSAIVDTMTSHSVNIILYLIALRYQLRLPLNHITAMSPTWSGFATPALAAAWLEENYSRINVEEMPLSSDKILGGIERKILRVKYNLVEV